MIQKVSKFFLHVVSKFFYLLLIKMIITGNSALNVSEQILSNEYSSKWYGLSEYL